MNRRSSGILFLIMMSVESYNNQNSPKEIRGQPRCRLWQLLSSLAFLLRGYHPTCIIECQIPRSDIPGSVTNCLNCTPTWSIAMPVHQKGLCMFLCRSTKQMPAQIAAPRSRYHVYCDKPTLESFHYQGRRGSIVKCIYLRMCNNLFFGICWRRSISHWSLVALLYFIVFVVRCTTVPDTWLLAYARYAVPAISSSVCCLLYTSDAADE